MIQTVRYSIEEVVAQIYSPPPKGHSLLEVSLHQEVPARNHLFQHHPEMTSML